MEALYTQVIMSKKKKILIATGGTGGHIFPAQELGKELVEKGFEVLFAGGSLSTNRYFKRASFFHKEVAASTLFRGNLLKSLWAIIKGVWQSFKVIDAFSPDLVVGFGSFYTFPLLLTAKLKKKRIVLFEPNAVPGKVNRFFSKWAITSAVQFLAAGEQMKGSYTEVKMPTGERKRVSSKEARDYFYLSPDRLTFLVFGGSQGAQSINHFFSEAISCLRKDRSCFQVIHVTGKAESAEIIRRKYEELGIRSCVKAFEERMDLAWSAADLAVCRSGAATIAEQIAFEVPTILIPFPKAADDHQMKNALFIEREVGGGITCVEKELNVDLLKNKIESMVEKARLKEMQEAILAFKKRDQKIDLCSLICKIIGYKCEPFHRRTDE